MLNNYICVKYLPILNITKIYNLAIQMHIQFIIPTLLRDGIQYNQSKFLALTFELNALNYLNALTKIKCPE